MKILYFDSPAGISGDMCLGALIDLGVDIGLIRSELKKLLPGGFEILAEKASKLGIRGTRFKVEVGEHAPRRDFSEIREMIEESSLSEVVKRTSVLIFTIIAEAEGKVHGVPPEEVHFHEVGAVDSIIDIVGTAVALEELGIEGVYTSAVPLGSGFVNCEHGRLPVPAPATLEIAVGMEIAPSTIKAELTTPTGAAILKALSRGFGPPPEMTLTGSGSGVGTMDFEEMPNILRVYTGETRERKGSSTEDEITVIETNIDDMNPQICGYLMDRLMEAGALDIYFTPVQMKKSRPALLLTVLSTDATFNTLTDIIFRETTTIGVRTRKVSRICLERKIVNVETRFGTLKVKVSMKDGEVINSQPEYDDARKIAEKEGVPLKDVIEEAKALLIKAWD